MPSTIDFASYNDADLLYGYQRVNKSKFPENFSACLEEIALRSLSLPTRYEIHSQSGDTGATLVSKVVNVFSLLAGSFTKRMTTTQA